MKRMVLVCAICIIAMISFLYGEDLCYQNVENGNYDRAIIECTKQINSNPNDYITYNNRGNAYSYKGEYDKAIEDYSKAIQINPEYALAYDNRGVAYGRKGEYDKAIEDLSKAIQINPEYANAYNNRGVAYRHKGEYEKAIEDYSKAIQINPKFAKAYNNLAWLYATAKDKKYRDGKKAVKFAKKSLKLTPDYAAAMDTLAAAYLEDKQPEEAYYTYLKVMDMDSSFIKTYQKYLKKKGYYTGAINGIISEPLKQAIKKCISTGKYIEK